MDANLTPLSHLPDWVPHAVRLYLDHTGEGVSLREIARREGKAASTILRQVRRYEMRRDDPLVDEVLAALTEGQGGALTPDPEDAAAMNAQIRPSALSLDEATIAREARRVLRRLAEPGAMMALAVDMENAVVLRQGADGHVVQTAVLGRQVAQAFALKEWISCRKAGRIATYEMTAAGRAALKRLIDADDRARMRAGMAEAQAGFVGAGQTDCPVGAGADPDEDGARRRIRYGAIESPVQVLARRRDQAGTAFLSPDLVAAAERLREDYELAQMGRAGRPWDPQVATAPGADPGLSPGQRAARDRVTLALRDLGPGLSDVALRVCCQLEGLEVAERRMGWAARSGKVVLRIALQRLRRHYEESYGKAGPLIG